MWLEKKHASEKEIWLIYYKKHTKKPTVAYNEAVEEALCFGWIDSIVKRIDDETYMQKYTPRKDNSIWSQANKKRTEKMISEGKMTKAGFDKIEIAKKNGQLEKAYTSQKKIEMPDYLEKELKKNELAWNNFNNFASSYQNMYIGWVTAAKRLETREKRITAVIARSVKNQKPEMM
jgi:uncharacterized protein YdeI (YjbR/CyaY-like superfamily)